MPDPDDAVINSAKRARGALKRNGPKVPDAREFHMEQQVEAGKAAPAPAPAPGPQPGDHLERPLKASDFDMREQKWVPAPPVRRYDPVEDQRNEPHHQWQKRQPEVWRDPREKWFDGPKPINTKT